MACRMGNPKIEGTTPLNFPQRHNQKHRNHNGCNCWPSETMRLQWPCAVLLRTLPTLPIYKALIVTGHPRHCASPATPARLDVRGALRSISGNVAPSGPRLAVLALRRGRCNQLAAPTTCHRPC